MLTYKPMVNEDHVVVHLSGDLDIDSTEVFECELSEKLEKAKTVELNFADVLFVDSSGMGMLMDLVLNVKERGTRITILNVREEIYEVFELLQLPQIIGEDVFK